MLKASEYLHRAEICRRMATSGPEFTRPELLAAAAAWDFLAAEVEEIAEARRHLKSRKD